jgi:phytoene dehydrogenase-like protein
MDRYDVIVLGAGIGGATCAALLARRGVRTLLVDKNAIPGGKAMTVGGKGFRYELWPIVGGPSLGSQFERVLEELGMADEVELLTPKASSVLMYGGPEGKIGRPRACRPSGAVSAPGPHGRGSPGGRSSVRRDHGDDAGRDLEAR